MTEGSNEMSPIPALTAELRAQARRAPGSWLYSIDPAYDPDGEVPPHAILGAWPVDEHGEPGEFLPNPQYRPSPGTAATDSVDAAIRQAAAGRGPVAAVLDAMADHTVYLPANADGELLAYEDERGPFVKILTDPQQGPPNVPQLVPVAYGDLLTVLPAGTLLRINPDAEVSVDVTTDDLRTAQESRAQAVPEIPRKGSDRRDQ
jgi:hypothetical protein